ncbi:MAG: 4Fe-4S binding protein [Clostridia bacterium]|nr:4Fe-4S binding protein [Clostridia bacterium]MBR5633387.1 4Fe-4S binding protein [Clostridia bacterium]
MQNYKHSVSLDVSKCKGCTACLKRCPTEAIRVRDGKATINSARCIDCGECIRICSHRAKRAIHDSLEEMADFKITVALPAPALYGQFDNMTSIDYIIDGLYKMGFDYVFEVACAAEMVSAYTRMYLNTPGIKKPVISSACPVITRIIGMNFPFLVENLMPILPPIEVAAMLAREKAMSDHPELSSDDIGVFFISPCPGKVSYVKNGFAGDKNNVDRVVSIRDVYFRLIDVMKHDEYPERSSESGMIGIGWASTGGESSSVFNDRYLAADGVENCIRVLEQIDNEDFTDLDFIELNACSGGCVGGAMTVANAYIAQARLQSLKRYLPVSPNRPTDRDIPRSFFTDGKVEYDAGLSLSSDRGEAMRMMGEIESITKCLPGIDCGSCGAPTCMAFAEDIVKNETNIDECTIIMRELFHECLDQRRKKELSEKIVPPNKTVKE